ncbi:MAG: hypothetical protein ACHQFX_01175 [Chitinophagales bacterium]
MKNICVCLIISLVFIGCSNSTDEKIKTVDTTIIGSDNPHPAPDTTGMNNGDSSRK